MATTEPRDPGTDARLAAALLAVDPVGLGGARLRAGFGLARDAWIQQLRDLLPTAAPWRRLPGHIGADRLLGALDFGATLHAGRPVLQRGLLAEADGGTVIVPMAERLPTGTQTLIAAAMDRGAVRIEREGLAQTATTRFALVLLDEGVDEECIGDALLDRVALHLDTDALTASSAEPMAFTRTRIDSARARLDAVRTDPELIEALCAAALRLGIASIRASQFALRAARASAALHGRDAVGEDDANLAARLVLAPRATVLPIPESPPDTAEPPPEQHADANAPPESPPESQTEPEREPGAEMPSLEDIVLAAATAALPAGLLQKLQAEARSGVRNATQGHAGAATLSLLRGRPAGLRRGEPQPGVRLNLIATLRAAAPWQPLRRAARPATRKARRIEIRREDFHVTRYQQRQQTTTIFLVDASGSSALHRLAEAKGAVELLLAECYVRRDEVAVIAFRGSAAELVLPPTRSLLRAKRSLAGLPGGGGTPLASAIDAGTALAESLRRRGATPTLVLLTDGRANITRLGRGGRAQAEDEARQAARRVAAAQLDALFIDTSPRAHPEAQRLAELMHARYLALPQADGHAMSLAVRRATIAARSH